jgi:hypothetical protein
MRMQSAAAHLTLTTLFAVGSGCSKSSMLKPVPAIDGSRDGAAVVEGGDADRDDRDGQVGQDGGPACVVQSAPLGAFDQAQAYDFQISAAGDGFFLAAVEGNGGTKSVSFAHADPDGVVGPVTRTDALLPDCGVSGLTSRLSGDQLLACSAGGRVDPALLLTQFVLTPLDVGASAPGPAAPLFVATVINQNRTSALATSFDGQRNVFAVGSPVVGAPVAAMAGVGGVVQGTPITIPIMSSMLLWRDLRVVPTLHGAMISVRDGPDGREGSDWHVLELDAAGTLIFDETVELPPLLAAAPIRAIATTPRGVTALFTDGEAPTFGTFTLVQIDRTQPRGQVPNLVTFESAFPAMAILGMVPQETGGILVAFLAGDATAVTLSAILVDARGGVVGPALVPLPGVDAYPTFIAGPGPRIDLLTQSDGHRATTRVSCAW